MHRSCNRWIKQGWELIACAMGRNSFTRVHGGEHVSGPEQQHQHACYDQRHEHEEVSERGEGVHSSIPLARLDDAQKLHAELRGHPSHGCDAGWVCGELGILLVQVAKRLPYGGVLRVIAIIGKRFATRVALYANPDLITHDVESLFLRVDLLDSGQQRISLSLQFILPPQVSTKDITRQLLVRANTYSDAGQFRIDTQSLTNKVASLGVEVEDLRIKTCKRVGDHSGLGFLALGCLDQLGPDALPIVGAQVLTRYRAFGGLLDRIAVLCRDRVATVQPVPDMLLLDSDRRGERRLTSDDFNCAFECFHKFSTLQQMFG